MANEILDSDLSIGERKRKFNPSNWFAIGILWIGIIVCLQSGLIKDIQVIIAILLLIVSTVMIYRNPRLGIRITLGVILLGVLSIVRFFPTQYFIGFGIGALKIGFEFIMFSIGLIHYYANRSELSTFLKDLFNREVSEKDLQAIERIRIENFKKRFLSKTVKELQDIVNKKELLPEAVKAAEEILEEKNKN